MASPTFSVKHKLFTELIIQTINGIDGSALMNNVNIIREIFDHKFLKSPLIGSIMVDFEGYTLKRNIKYWEQYNWSIYSIEEIANHQKIISTITLDLDDNMNNLDHSVTLIKMNNYITIYDLNKLYQKKIKQQSEIMEILYKTH